MPNPKGNPGNSGGIKGKSGRKSAYQERADADFLWDVFLNKYSIEEIKAKIRKGKFSIKDVWVSKLVGGNERLLNQLVRKLFPDKFEGKYEGTFVLKSNVPRPKK